MLQAVYFYPFQTKINANNWYGPHETGSRVDSYQLGGVAAALRMGHDWRVIPDACDTKFGRPLSVESKLTVYAYSVSKGESHRRTQQHVFQQKS